MSTTWEQGLIGSLIADQNTWGEMVDVAPADLYIPQHRVIYTTAANLAKVKGLSASTLIRTLDQTGELTNIGDETVRGADYITKLVSMGDPITAREFAKQVLNQSDLRRLQEVGALLISQARAANKNAQDILQDHVQAILKVQRNTREPRLIGSINPTYQERVRKIISGESIPFWEPPIGALRKVLPHLEDVDFMLIAGTPGTGKSSLVRALGLMTAAKGKSVLAMPFENSEEEYHSWAISQIARVNHYAVVDPRKRAGDDAEKIAKAIQRLEELPYYIYAMGIATINELVAAIKSFVVKHPEIGLIIVDGIYLIGGKGDAYENISANTQTLRSLAQDLHIPIIGTTQFKRLQKENGKKKAELDSLLYAGENASRIVLSIEKDEMTTPDIAAFPENKDENGKLLLSANLNTVVVRGHVLKNTNGRTGYSGDMAWRKPYNVFDSLPEDWRAGRQTLDQISQTHSNGNGNGNGRGQSLTERPIVSVPKPNREDRDKNDKDRDND